MSNVSQRAAFEKYYAGQAPWDHGRPQAQFVAIADRVVGPVLDAGCGSGENALFFAGRGHRVTGIDFVDEPIRRARVKAAERGLSVDFLVKDALALGRLGRAIRQRDRLRALPRLVRRRPPALRRRAVGRARAGRPAVPVVPQRRGIGDRRAASCVAPELYDAFAIGWEVESVVPSGFEGTRGIRGHRSLRGRVERMVRGRQAERRTLMHEADLTESPIDVVAICGSLRPGSHTRQASWSPCKVPGGRCPHAAGRPPGLQSRLLWAGRERCSPEGVLRLRREVGRAQGLILGTPEYHGGFSGVLKNALDLMSPEEIRGKVIGLVGVSGGASGGIDALNGLRRSVARCTPGSSPNRHASRRPTTPSARRGTPTIRGLTSDSSWLAETSPVLRICIRREERRNS